MNFRRIFALLKKELLHGPRGFILTMIIGTPLLITLVINLALGDLLDSAPELALYDAGQSQISVILEESQAVRVKIYASPGSLRDAVSRGAVDSGILLPAGLDDSLANGEKVPVTVYFWGESLARDRAIIISTITDAAGRQSRLPDPVTLQLVQAAGSTGSADIPWNQRLLPMTILIAVFFGGLMLPAVSLIEEKHNRTLQALSVTPASYQEIFLAKGLVGAILSLLMGILIMLINRAWGGSPAVLLLILALSAVMAAQIGTLLGTVIRDMNTLFAVWKFGGLVLFGPAVIYMFPEIPQWLSYFFPTYYVTGPIIDISLGTAGGSTWVELGIAAAIILALVVLQMRLSGRLTGASFPKADQKAGI